MSLPTVRRIAFRMDARLQCTKHAETVCQTGGKRHEPFPRLWEVRRAGVPTLVVEVWDTECAKSHIAHVSGYLEYRTIAGSTKTT